MTVLMQKPKALSLKLDFDTLAEFNVAAKIFRARSVTSFLHFYVVSQINEARKTVSAEEFERLVEIEKGKIIERGELRRPNQMKLSPTGSKVRRGGTINANTKTKRTG